MTPEQVPTVDVRELVERRIHEPAAIAEAAANRKRRNLVDANGRLLIVAVDHPARGALRVGDRPLAMADRKDLLERVLVALSRPGVDGVLATPDIVDDLLLLGALDGHLVIGSMNRGGLSGATFEIDDRFTAYDVDGVERAGLDGGKMLVRIDPGDHATAALLESSAQAVSGLAQRQLMAMVEPFLMRRVAGQLTTDLSPEAMARALGIASGLGTTSAYTWLKVPVVEDMERVMAAATLPALILGGDVTDDPDVVYARWAAALELPTVRGLVVGRSLLYPADDDVAAAVDTAVGLL
ncbi:MAG: aldolase [Streptosporangiales bacterium]|nr:aldolase [Streptosporangiales bacterium]